MTRVPLHVNEREQAAGEGVLNDIQVDTAISYLLRELDRAFPLNSSATSSSNCRGRNSYTSSGWAASRLMSSSLTAQTRMSSSRFAGAWLQSVGEDRVDDPLSELGQRVVHGVPNSHLASNSSVRREPSAAATKLPSTSRCTSQPAAAARSSSKAIRSAWESGPSTIRRQRAGSSLCCKNYATPRLERAYALDQSHHLLEGKRPVSSSRMSARASGGSWLRSSSGSGTDASRIERNQASECT
jgi:hypothetical protein